MNLKILNCNNIFSFWENVQLFFQLKFKSVSIILCFWIIKRVRETGSIQLWTHFNNVQPIDQINTGSGLKQIKRRLTFKNYASFPIYYLKGQSAFEILTSSYMIWVRSSCVSGNKGICVMPYWKMCEKKYDKSYTATLLPTPYPLVFGSLVCSLKISGVRQIFITSFVYKKM